MNPNGPDEPISNDERRVSDAVRGLSSPTPDPAFRARLREQFVSGQFERPAIVRLPWFRRPAVWGPALAAAAALVVTFLNRGPDWQVLATSGEGRVVVAGRAFDAADRAGIGAAIARGGEVAIEGPVTLDLVARGSVAVALAPDTRMQLPAAPARWWSRHAVATVMDGNVYFSTGRDFHGATLDVLTENVAARCVGTSFAVLRSDLLGTCVCVMEGQVNVAKRESGAGTGIQVPSGMRRFINPQGGETTRPILEDSAHHLHRQLSDVGKELGRE
ncbi:MAG: FecR domain-containing protein [Candidatus Eisenbacteria bacterium]|nr:FecR domain-containing protein [Candidatus Eisenbacteria bacterium]